MRERSLPLARRVMLAAALAAWATSGWAGTPQSGENVIAQRLGGMLDLSDSRGRARRLADFRGKAVLFFFGYTRCPDVCPTTLLRVAQTMRLLGAEASRVQVLWMTVDPERDSRALVSNYLAAFNPGFLGLWGTRRQTDAVADAYKIQYDITYFKDEVFVSHSSFGYLIDGRGRTRVRIRDDATPEQIAHDVRDVLASD
jgi:protein SCO1/2